MSEISFKARFCQRCGRPLDRDGQICSDCKNKANKAREKRHRGYRAAYSKAKREALRRLSEAHPDQYEVYLREELKAVGASSVEEFEALQGVS